MVWPLEDQGALRFASGKKELLVVEEKRGIIESQFKEHFYDFPGSEARTHGRQARRKGRTPRPLDARAWRRDAVRDHRQAPRPRAGHEPVRTGRQSRAAARADRCVRRDADALFLLGLPAQTPRPKCRREARRACRDRLSFHGQLDGAKHHLPDPDGRGKASIGSRGRSSTAGKHVFQNLGEGTYYHSGSLAVRQAIAAGTNITYKILFNDAVAMTGGQAVDGPISVQAIAHSLVSEGARKLVVVSDRPESFKRSDFPGGVEIKHRREMDHVQRELREIEGTTVIVYQQTCATEKRRLRKRGKMEDPEEIRGHQPAGLRGLRRLLGRVELPERRAAGDRVWPQAQDQPELLQTRTSPA